MKKLPQLRKHLGQLFDRLLPDKIKISVETAPVKVELEKALRDTATWEEQGLRLLEALRVIPEGESVVYKELRELALQIDERMDEALVNRVYNERLLGATGQRALSHYQERLDQALTKSEADAARYILDLASDRPPGISEAKLYDRMNDELSTPADMIDPLLRILLHDGYLKREGKRFRFRSRLLRDWWRGERAAVRHARSRRKRKS